MISRFTSTFLLLGAALLTCSPTLAVNPIALDRDYQFGDDAVEGASADVDVTTTFSGFTADSANSASIGGNNDSFQDIEAFGNPFYRDVSDRPGIASGLGIEFDGDGDYLKGANLNDPSTSAASFAYDDDEGDPAANTPGPLNYSGIANRFLQFWVKPDSASQANDQTIVTDADQHGVRIAGGKWSMRYAGADFDSDVDVAFDQWSHVMVTRPLGAANGSRMYVNGEAVTAAGGGYNGGSIDNLVIGSNTSRDENNAFDGGTEEFFHGVIDNLSMWVIGDNTGDPGPPIGQDFGEFDLFADNDFIADIYAFDLLDLDQDGTANAAGDVAAFVAGWRSTQEFNGVQVGGLNTLANGDVNFDGITNLLDWSIINAASPTAGGLIMAALNGQGVPEPGSMLLLGVGLTLAVSNRNRRR